MFPWLTLALVGNSTSSILFGTGVTCPIYRYHPATVAQAFASLAILNPGRVFLGLAPASGSTNKPPPTRSATTASATTG